MGWCFQKTPDFSENVRLENKNESNAFSSMRISDYIGKTDLSCGLAGQKLIKTGIAVYNFTRELDFKGETAMYEIKVLNTLPECKSYEHDWVDLCKSMEYPSPFAYPDWVCAAFKNNSSEQEPHITIVLKNAKVVGLLPLYKRKRGMLRELRFSGDTYFPDPLGICCKPEDRKSFIAILINHFSRYRDWDVIRLPWVLSSEALEWEKAGATIRCSAIAPFIPLTGSMELYLRKFKKRINFAIRKVTKIDFAGGQYHSTQSTGKCLELLDQLFDLHSRRSKEKAIESSFSGEKIIQFHKEVIRTSENVYFHWLTLDDSIIAVLYGFLFKDRFFYYQISHDPKKGALSPGAVLLYKSLEQCCLMGVTEYNFLQGDEAYKWKWTKDSKTLYSVDMYNKTLNGIVLKYQNKFRDMLKALLSNWNK